jgi:hypothetical protein
MTLFRNLILLAAAPVIAGNAAAIDPAQILFDLGVKSEAAGNLDGAKAALVTLVSTYHGDPLAERAKSELAALCLYQEAQAEVRNGKPNDGYAAYRLVARAFPESPLAALANESAKSLGIPPDPRR